MEIAIPLLGMSTIFLSVLFGPESLQIQVLLVLVGVLILEAGVWGLTSGLLPNERHYVALREEGDHFIELIRELNAATVVQKEGGEDDGSFGRALQKMHGSVDRMGELAGQDDRDTGAETTSRAPAETNAEVKRPSEYTRDMVTVEPVARPAVKPEWARSGARVGVSGTIPGMEIALGVAVEAIPEPEGVVAVAVEEEPETQVAVVTATEAELEPVGELEPAEGSATATEAEPEAEAEAEAEAAPAKPRMKSSARAKAKPKAKAKAKAKAKPKSKRTRSRSKTKA